MALNEEFVLALVNKCNLLVGKEDYEGALECLLKAGGIVEKSGTEGLSKGNLELIKNTMKTFLHIEKFIEQADKLKQWGQLVSYVEDDDTDQLDQTNVSENQECLHEILGLYSQLQNYRYKDQNILDQTDN